jgi:hypothetical protein
VKFTEQDLVAAVDDLATIPRFPYNSRPAVMSELVRMCPHREALRWTIRNAVANCITWPGMAELRGLLCSRYEPLDGIDRPYCSIPGFTADECEQKYIERHAELKQQESTPISPGSRAMLSGIGRKL